MNVIAKQLSPHGTFTCAGFGAARFEDARVQDIYTRRNQSAGRALLKKDDDPEKLIAVMARTQGSYKVAPLDETLFLPGAQRIRLNMEKGGIIAPFPRKIPVTEPLHMGANDIEVTEREEGWNFVMDLDGVREHLLSFPFAREEPGIFAELWREIEDVVKDRCVKGHWPAQIILATRS